VHGRRGYFSDPVGISRRTKKGIEKEKEREGDTRNAFVGVRKCRRSGNTSFHKSNIASVQ